jgi:hypothetical protein
MQRVGTRSMRVMVGEFPKSVHALNSSLGMVLLPRPLWFWPDQAIELVVQNVAPK